MENVENILGDLIEFLEKLVEVSYIVYIFKYLFNNIYYFFVVIVGNVVGEGIKYINL